MQVNIILIAMLCIVNTWFLWYINRRLNHIEVKLNMIMSMTAMLSSLIAELKVNDR